MIRSARAVRRHRATELRDDQHRGVPPNRAERRLERGDRAVEQAQIARQLAVLALLADVRVPAAEIDGRDPRAVRPAEDLSRRLGKLHDRRRPTAHAAGIMAFHHGLRFARDGEGSAEQRIVAVQRSPAARAGRHRAPAAWRATRSRSVPGRAAPAARSARGRSPRCRSACCRCALGRTERDIEPAGLAAEGLDRAVLEQVLRIEMRALAVRRRDGVQHRELPRGIELVHLRKMRVQAEVAVEIERAAGRARRRDGERAALRGVLRIAVRRPRPRARPCRRAGT